MKIKSHLRLLTMVVMLSLTSFSLINAQTNYALKMSKASDAVLFDNVALSPGTIWTAEMWVKRNTQSNFSTLIDGATSKFTLETWASGNAWTYKVGLSKKGSGDQTFNYVMPLNTWTHLAYVSNGTTVSLYANGELKGAITQTIDLPMKGFGLLGNPNESALATIDEVRYWKVARTKTEIQENMNKSVEVNSANLVAYWYFDDKATKITDLSSSGLFGTNSGCTYVVNDNNAFVTSHAAMQLESVTCLHKNEYLLKAGAVNQEILCIQVNTTGVTSPLSLTSLVINMSGTSNLADVSKVAVSSTGSSSAFASTSLLGTKVNPVSGDITFAGNIILRPGKNYFWAVYDIASTAPNASVFDARCVSATINGANVSPVVGSPAGNRTVAEEVINSLGVANIIPKPSNMSVTGGNLTLTNQFKIKYQGEGLAPQADSLAVFLNKATGFSIVASAGNAEPNAISLEIITDATLGQEGYKLDVTSDRVVIKSQTAVGAFWGIQSLRQLLPALIESATVKSGQQWTMPQVSITDVPRFRFRSMHLDVARHFFSPAFVKKYIDMLAMYKINHFHWHLTEDQGWRIEIKKYPKLQTISAWRTCSGTKYGGYYTQDEVKDIVAYATSKNITIIPEIEMPGHSVSVLAAYPEFACTSATTPFSVRCAWGISTDILCGGKESVRTFLKDVLEEVAELFPGKYIHIGGDEAPKNNWNTCDDCKARIVSKGITGADQTAKSNTLQKELVEEMAQFLAPKGKTVIGWDEVTHGGIPTGATIQAWNVGVNVGQITSAGHDVIMSNYTKLYLDSKQSTEVGEPGATWMGYNTLDVVYNYDPMPSGLTTSQQARVLGSEACIWTEELQTSEVVEYMLVPRMQAMVERAWTPNSLVNFEDFKSRLVSHFERFEYLNFNSRKLPVPQSSTKSIVSCEPVVLKSDINGTSYYWTDDARSTTQEITVNKSGVYKSYVKYLGEVVETTYDVVIEKKNESVEIEKNKLQSTVELEAKGAYDTYNWYSDNMAAYPTSTGKKNSYPSDADLSNYYVSGLQYKSNLSSLQLDGANDLLEFEAGNFMNNTQKFTFETWVFVRSWREWDVLFSKFTENANRVVVEFGKQGELYCHVSKGGSAYGQVSGVLNLNTWTHVAVVFDGTKTGNANRLKLYINGEQKTLTFTGTIQNSTPSPSNPLRLGHPTQEPSVNFADVRFWNSARSNDEVKNNMFALAAYDASLKLYYPMNNVIGVNLFDVVSGAKASLKNSDNASGVHAVPGLMLAACESQRWKLSDVVKDITGVNKPQGGLGVEIYPNPSSSDVSLKVDLLRNEDVAIDVCNMNGQNFYRDRFESGSFLKTLPLGNLNKGVYFVTVKAGKNEKTMKLIMQ